MHTSVFVDICLYNSILIEEHLRMISFKQDTKKTHFLC